MADQIYDIIQDLKRMKRGLPMSFRRSVNNIHQQIVALVMDQLYNHGIDGNGDPLEPEYEEATIQWKEWRNRQPGHIYEPTDHVALFETGDFYAGFYVHWEGNSFRVWSKDWKANDLAEIYGEAIFDLTEENKERLFGKLQTDIKNEQLKFFR